MKQGLRLLGAEPPAVEGRLNPCPNEAGIKTPV